MRDFLIAHRGESYDAPENTLAAVNLAWKRGAKSVEIDVQLTVDNEVVVIHDSDTHRITGVKKIIRKSTLAELRRLDFGSYKDQQWKDECIPTLQEVLETVPPEGKLIIEIKSDHSILDMLKGELDKTGLKESQIEIIAFDFQTLAKAKQMMPDNKMLWLLDLDYSWPHWLVHINKDRLVRKIRKHHLDGVNVWAGKLLSKSFIEAIKRSDMLIYCWTVNDPEKVKVLIDNGIDGIASDRPSWILSQIEKQ